MARHETTTTLIESAIRRAMLPVTNITFKEKDFLAFANEELDMALVPYVLSFHEDYFLTPGDIPLVSGRSSYPIPYRAIGNKLRDVQIKDRNGNLYELTRIGVGDEPYFQYGSGGVSEASLRAFSLQNNSIKLYSNIDSFSADTIVAHYYIRPNKLVSETRAMIITSLTDLANGNIVVDKVPVGSNNSTLFSSGTVVDFIQVKSPHKCLKIDVPLTAVDSINNIISIDPTNIPQDLAVGDHILLSEECIIPQIPTDLHSMLAQRIACRCLEALGDREGLAAANAKLQEMETKGGTILDNRVDDAPKKINPRHGLLRLNVFGRWGK